MCMRKLPHGFQSALVCPAVNAKPGAKSFRQCPLLFFLRVEYGLTSRNSCARNIFKPQLILSTLFPGIVPAMYCCLFAGT